MTNKAKKTILVLIGAGCLLVSQAQINLGAKLGLSIANQKRIDHEDYYEQTTQGRAAFHIGVFADRMIARNIFLQPGISFTNKGANHTSSYSGTKSEFKMSYLELPLNIVYKYPVGAGKIYVGAGPVIGLATSGRIEQNGKSKTMFEKGEDWKRGDLGLNILAGVELKNGFIAGLSVNTGVVDIYKHEAAKIRNRTINLSVGYLWNRAQ